MKKIANDYIPNEKYDKIKSETIFVYEPETEWTYSHHSFITYYKNKFYLMWSNGRENEDDIGQRIMVAHSDDFYNWCTPYPIVDVQMGKHSEMTLTAGGFYFNGDELNIYYAQYEYNEECIGDGTRIEEPPPVHSRTQLMVCTTTDMKTLSEPIFTGLPMIFNSSPKKMKSGRLIACGHSSFPYTDNPNGIDDWVLRGICGQSSADKDFDDNDVFVNSDNTGLIGKGFIEGFPYETDDGIIHTMLRSEEHYLYHSQSTDNGVTWSVPEKTEFSDDKARFFFGRLPDGRYYYVGNPNGDGGRNPLVLSISNDGYNFDKHYIIKDEPYMLKKKGKHKGGLYGYPYIMVADGYLYVSYSIYKESIAVTRINLKDII